MTLVLTGIITTLLPPVATKAKPSPAKLTNNAWLRTDHVINNPKVSPRRSLIAFRNKDSNELNIINTITGKTYRVTKHRFDPFYFWSPDGCRLFYLEYSFNKDKKKQTKVNSFDCTLKKNITVKTYKGIAGGLTFDPRDYRVHFMFDKKIESIRIELPGERIKLWKSAMKTSTNKWLVTQKKVMIISRSGFKINGLEDDSSGIESYEISPDGESITWATKAGTVYFSSLTGTAKEIAKGRDPSWHPNGEIIVYSRARYVGKKIRDYDIGLHTATGTSKILKHNQTKKERWPRFSIDGRFILYTHQSSTDLFQLSYRL